MLKVVCCKLNRLLSRYTFGRCVNSYAARYPDDCLLSVDVNNPGLQCGLLSSMISINEVRLMKGRSPPNRGVILKFTGRNKGSSEKPDRTMTTQARIRTHHFPNTSHGRSSFNLMMLRGEE